ncbi:OmpP1/FadL family transporter [Robertkochia flava]|uniref:OmpP1/FadL family transporter n=1 Tax=Robertkochia flava TaxID=3447986 RepID=UPI001CCFD2F4|nr:outer membrane protein transport protein [Robertkochia marina]
MKRLLSIVIPGLLMSSLYGQDISDVTALGTTNLLGTARYQAMSGAFGALGGDLSALNNNPAASAVFNYSTFTFTGSIYQNRNVARFGNTTSVNRDTNFELNQAGGVLVFNNRDQKSGWKKFSMGFNYDIQTNFDNDIFISGRGAQSVADYFIANANGFSPDDLSVLSGETITDAYINIGNSLGYNAQQGFLGYQAFVINPSGSNSNTYVSNAILGSGLEQEQRIITRGTDSKFTFNMGAQHNSNLYMGIGINLHAVDRRKIVRFDEFNYDPDSPLQYVQFDNELLTFGSGFSANAGIIAKLGESLRFGASYQTPTWYNLTDELWQAINTDLLNSDNGQVELIEVYPDVIYRFPDYSIRIPSKYMASGAIVVGKSGLISMDYTYQDMSNARLRPSNDPFFAEQNSLMNQELKAVSSLRLGAEFRLGAWSFRGGYRFEETPYQNSNAIGDLTGYSLGAGINFGGSQLDFAWATSDRDRNQALYPNMNTQAGINTELSNWVLSYSIKF